MARKLLASVVAVLAAAGLAAIAGAPVAGAQTSPFASTSGCASLFGFAAEPVPVARAFDRQTVLASVEWGYSVEHNICCLVLDAAAVEALGATPPAVRPQQPTAADAAAAAKCHNAHNPDWGFAAEPVPVAKSADGQTVLAWVRWRYSIDHDICYLILDDAAQQSLLNTHRQGSITFTAVAAGGFHSCGVRANQSVKCWGTNEYGQLNAPVGWFAAVAAGGFHSCGLKADDSVECWGGSEFGQADAPAGPFKSVSAGFVHSCGLRADDSVECWGYDSDGRADAPAGPFKSVSAGFVHSCGIRANDSVECGGGNEIGQGDAPADRFDAVAAGGFHSCGIRADGAIECWDWTADLPIGVALVS